MREACNLVWSVLALLFQSRASLGAEIVVLRHQLNIQRRHLPKRLTFSAMDRLIFVGLYHLVPNAIKALTIVKPDTVIRWHRAGFRSYWRWRSRNRCGRPTVLLEIRRLIREMSIANRCGERRESMESFSSSASRSARPAWPSTWRGGGASLAGMEDVPSQPCGWHCRNGPLRCVDNLVPTALWFADHRPRPAVDPVVWSDRAPNGRMARQSIRRECIDHVVVFGERHLRHILLSYKDYYNTTRTHLSLNKDAPVPRGVEWAVNIVCRPMLGGLHHQYGRM